MIKRVFIVIIFFLVLQVPGVFAHGDHIGAPEATGSLIDELNENLSKQEDLRNKIAAAQSQEESLTNDISYLENQIELTKLEIAEANTRLNQLAVDIEEVNGKLDETKDELDYTNKIASERLKEIYKQSFYSNFSQFLGVSSFNEFLTRQKYTESIREQDLQLLAKLESLKKQFDGQKATLEEAKKKEDELQVQLESKTASLATQQDSKQYVLNVTKNNEQQYRALLAQVQQEIASIAAALGGGVNLGPVKRGDVIAFQGNTGCSTGSHLHFGFYPSGSTAVNPLPYLNSGALRWPMNNPTVSQWFGQQWTPHIPPHNGIDMYVTHGAPIYAARDGVAYLNTDNGCPWIPGITGTVPGKWITIEHSNGWKTIYGHVQ